MYDRSMIQEIECDGTKYKPIELNVTKLNDLNLCNVDDIISKLNHYKL